MTEADAAGAGTSSRLPDFFIVGHHKSGTTALYEMLRRHPQVFMPDLKEPRFMASDMRSRLRYDQERRHPETLQEYLDLFAAARPDEVVGEASATYLWSHTAAERIAQAQPAARIIAIFREPASFLRSLHLTFLRGHVESERDLRKAIDLEEERRQGRKIPPRSHLPQLLQYSDQVRYAEQLRRYRSRFPPEQVQVLIYDDFRSDNEGTVRSVFRFLEVDDQVPIEHLDTNVTSRMMRSQQLDDMLFSVANAPGGAARLARPVIKAMTPRRLRRGAYLGLRRRAVMAEAPPPDEALMAELRSRFKPEVVALGEYLDRDLVSLWGYDQVP